MLSLLHRKLRTAALALPLALLALCGPATAGTIDPGLYALLDHGDGQLGPDYGLRVDFLGLVFSVELGGAGVALNWDGGTTALISGQVHDNATGDLWDVSYQLTGVSALGTLGFEATAGSGTLVDPNDPGNPIAITGEQNGSGVAFSFLADGFRISGDSDTPVGRGWLLPANSTDDWLVRADRLGPPLAEPAALGWIAPALAAIGGLRRRR